MRAPAVAGFLLVFALSAFLLGSRSGTPPLGIGYLDYPVTAQDEAVYSHAAIAMAEPGGDRLTPEFMGRFFLYKPPLSYWLAAGSAKAFGVSAFALRLPSVLAAALTAALVFLWVTQASGGNAWRGAMAVTLLHLGGLFPMLARRNMTDALVMAAVTASAWLLSRGGGAVVWIWACVAVGVLAKSLAGLIPILMLAAWWWVVAREARPSWMRAAGAVVAGLGVAMPWFIYQWVVHRQWFEGEFIGVELLAYGASAAAPQASAEWTPWFYGVRLWRDSPALAVAFLAGVPALVQQLRRERTPSVAAIVAAITVMTAAVSGYRYRNATYLLPLIPLLAVGAGVYAHAAVLAMAMALAGYGLGARQPARAPDTALLRVAERYCEMDRGNDLVVVGIGDNFAISTLPLARLRYAIRGALGGAGQVTLDFRSMGIVLPVAEFNQLDAGGARARYAPRLREWGLRDDRALGTVIGWETYEDLGELVSANPDRDFLFPHGLTARVTHRVMSGGGNATLLLSHRALPRPSARVRACRL